MLNLHLVSGVMSLFGELKCLQVWGNFPEFPHGFSFHLQPTFPCGFPPQTTTIPGDSPRNPRGFVSLSFYKIIMSDHNIITHGFSDVYKYNIKYRADIAVSIVMGSKLICFGRGHFVKEKSSIMGIL